MDVYLILWLWSNIISIGQFDERGCQVLVDNGMLRIRDRQRRLLTKLKLSSNQLYILNIRLVQPMRLAMEVDEEPWLWHARFGHMSFNVLGRMVKVDRCMGSLLIKHNGELCDNCLAGKQRRLPW
jgi:hypothetical protein